MKTFIFITSAIVMPRACSSRSSLASTLAACVAVSPKRSMVPGAASGSATSGTVPLRNTSVRPPGTSTLLEIGKSGRARRLISSAGTGSARAQQRELAAAAAALADDAGFPLMVDLRPGLVIIDSGKDQWEDDAHGLELDFTDLAESLQTAARDLGATADLGLPRFAQLFLDAADVAAVRAFWVGALGYTHDPRAGVSDIYDPRRLNPVLVFQELDASETERRRQRNRIHFELAVPSDVVQTRLAATVAAGGRLVDESEGRWRVADPEGNEVVLVSGA